VTDAERSSRWKAVAGLLRRLPGQQAPIQPRILNEMHSKNLGLSGPPAPSRPATPQTLLTPKQAARLLNLSVSWLANRRLAGDGPPYVKLGGAVRYAEGSLQQWMKAHQRMSTSG
jgi:predicted DNA-binding transcriptional regulator AlpA